MSNTQMGLMGRKLGMTQIYNDNQELVPVTVVEAGPNAVIRVKTSDSADGYAAVQLGFGERKSVRTTKPMAGNFEKAGVSPKQHVREMRVTDEVAAQYAPGQSLGPADFFKAGDSVDVSGISKGRGFAGVMKRHNFAGFESSHGAHEYFRHGGSIGTRLTPGMVLKGKKMPGHMGSERVTLQNVAVVKVDPERNLVYLRGGVPGPTGAIVVLRSAVKIAMLKARRGKFSR